MDARLRLVLVLGCAAGALGALSLALPSPWDLVAVAPWALALGGPLALWLLHPMLLADERGWARLLAYALPGLAVAGALRESLRVLWGPFGQEFAQRHHAMLALHALWLLATLALAFAAGRRLSRDERGPTLGLALTALLAATVADVMLALVLVEVGALLAASRFERAPAAWGRAAAAASIVLLVGLAGLWTAAGAPWPPRLALDGTAFGLGILPLLAAAGLAFVATLLLAERAPRAAPA